MSDLRTAAQQALEALEKLVVGTEYEEAVEIERTITALRAALAEPAQDGCAHCNHPLYAAIKCKVCGRVTEPVQEPVASIYITLGGEREFDDWRCDLPVGRNELYTFPPHRKPLTHDELLDILQRIDHDTKRLPPGFRDFARAIERAHGITGAAA